jgi:tetratricopeptide (TPR) repeat protein
VKSSEGPLTKVAPNKFQLVALLVMAASVAAIAELRAGLAERYHQVRVKNDLYALPAPEQLIVASLGYRSAVADVLYAYTLVWYGTHLQERRRFEYVGNYLDAITTLDSNFRAPFLYADTLVTMQAEPARREDYEKARELLERGMRAFPHDAELWVNAGQFMAYLAVPYLEDENLKQKWRLDGARVLAKSCEFVSNNENIPYHCITAAALLSKAGEREATLRFLERVLAVNDDDELRKYAMAYYEQIQAEQDQQRLKAREQRFREAWAADLRFVTKDMLLLLGPHFDPARCAGLAAAGGNECATTWRRWFEKALPEGNH